VALKNTAPFQTFQYHQRTFTTGLPGKGPGGRIILIERKLGRLEKSTDTDKANPLYRDSIFLKHAMKNENINITKASPPIKYQNSDATSIQIALVAAVFGDYTPHCCIFCCLWGKCI
jgi:hypothetical protein